MDGTEFGAVIATPPKNKRNNVVRFLFYKRATRQQPAKGVLNVSESLTRRVKRFTTKPTGACSVARLKGEQAGKEPMGRNEDEPHRMSLVSLQLRRRRAARGLVKAAACRRNQSLQLANS